MEGRAQREARLQGGRPRGCAPPSLPVFVGDWQVWPGSPLRSGSRAAPVPGQVTGQGHEARVLAHLFMQ